MLAGKGRKQRYGRFLSFFTVVVVVHSEEAQKNTRVSIDDKNNQGGSRSGGKGRS